MAPVGRKPSASVATSVSVTDVALRLTVAGIGVVMSVGLAALTDTCSLTLLRSLAVLLLLSPV